MPVETAAPFGTQLEDLDWIDQFASNVRPYVRVRLDDCVLIKIPVEAYPINESGARLLDRVLRGEKISEVARSAGVERRPERIREIHAFFCDVRDLLSNRMGDGRGRLATSVSRFGGSFTRYPVLSEIALTYRCNQACRFCYAGCEGGAGDSHLFTRRGKRVGGYYGDQGAGEIGDCPQCEDMPRDDVLRCIDAIASDAKVPSVSFTGGEPTLCHDLPLYVAHARSCKLRVNLITNGMACAADGLVAQLAEAGLNSAQVSLEGPGAAIHDELTRRPGSFDQACQGIVRLRDAGIRVHTNTTICALNCDHLCDVVDLAKSLGLTRVSMNHIIPIGAPGRDDAGRSIQIAYSDIGRHVLRVRDHAARAGIEFLWYSPSPFCLFNPIAHGLGNKGCAACDGLLHVSPSGDVLPCSSWPQPVGHLLRDGFEKVWFGERAQRCKKKEMAHEVCRSCEHFALCQGACVLYWRGMGYDELLNRESR